jgi:hypothetical protein
MAKRRLRREDYTVGWVCALPIEVTVAEEMLDEEHLDLPQDANGTNRYALGRIGDHNIVTACLPAGQSRTNSAAAVAVSFAFIRFQRQIYGLGMWWLVNYIGSRWSYSI